MQGADLPILPEWQVLHDIEAEAEGVQILQKERGKTMSRYINREDLLKNLKQFAPEYLKPLIVSLIEKQPTADVAEVVRCKDCKHFDKNKGYRDTKFSFSFCDKFHHNIITENDFCSYGERMDGMDGETE